MTSDAQAPGVADLRVQLDERSVTTVPVPADCNDGFAGANWRRPEVYLDASVREAISSIAQLPPEVAARGAGHLARDISSGTWDSRYGALRALTEYDLGYRLVVAG